MVVMVVGGAGSERAAVNSHSRESEQKSHSITLELRKLCSSSPSHWLDGTSALFFSPTPPLLHFALDRQRFTLGPDSRITHTRTNSP